MTFTETVRAALIANGWEVYEGLEMPELYEWWWKPTEHKRYWSNPRTPDEGRDWYMPIDQAIGQQMLDDRQSGAWAGQAALTDQG